MLPLIYDNGGVRAACQAFLSKYHHQEQQQAFSLLSDQWTPREIKGKFDMIKANVMYHLTAPRSMSERVLLNAVQEELPSLIEASAQWGQWYSKSVQRACLQLVKNVLFKNGATANYSPLPALNLIFDEDKEGRAGVKCTVPRSLPDLFDTLTLGWYKEARKAVHSTLKTGQVSQLHVLTMKLYRAVRSLCKKIRVRTLVSVLGASSKQGKQGLGGFKGPRGVAWLDTCLSLFNQLLSKVHKSQNPMDADGDDKQQSLFMASEKVSLLLDVASASLRLAEHARCRYNGDNPYHPHQLWFDGWTKELVEDVIEGFLRFTPCR